MKYIEECLKANHRLRPLETNYPSHIQPVKNIKAVIFDIYGTLVISASGDVEITKFSKNNAVKTLNYCNVKIIEKDTLKAAKLINNHFKSIIKQFHEEKKENGVKYPEVDYRTVWKMTLEYLTEENIITYDDYPNLTKLSMMYEFLNNPAWPMPEMNEVLKKINEKNYLMGIISNAQFFTPIMLNYFMTCSMEEVIRVPMFNPDIQLYSYEQHVAKPGLELYKTAKTKLAEKNIKPEEVLYIGNDMLNDIYPAHTVGFKTVLYAGDRRSLRTRENHELVKNIKPDFTINHLKALEEVLEL